MTPPRAPGPLRMYGLYAVMFFIVGGGAFALPWAIVGLRRDALALLGVMAGPAIAGVPLALSGLVARYSRIAFDRAVLRVVVIGLFGAALCYLWSFIEIESVRLMFPYPPERYAWHGFFGALVAAVVVETIGWQKA